MYPDVADVLAPCRLVRDLNGMRVRPEIKAKTLLVELFRVRKRALKLVDGALSGFRVVLLLLIDRLAVQLAGHLMCRVCSYTRTLALRECLAMSVTNAMASA